MYRLVCALFLLLVVGCSGDVHKLPEEYEPLERVKESSLRSEGYVTTVGDTLYVHDLKDWLEVHVPGSPKYKATLLHEQQHSIRQKDEGLAKWIARYGFDTDFMWEEEQIGWYYEIITLRQWGLNPSPEAIANSLSNYKNLSGRMVSYNDALMWVRAVLNGQWKPPQ